MNPNALQMASIAYHSMDNATFLSFMHTIIERGQDEATMREKMGQYYTDFNGAYMQYDLAFNPARRSLESEDLVVLDGDRDNSLGAYHEAVLGLQRNPNEAKRQAARLLKLNFDTYSPDRGQEYMKETELIEQMTTEIHDNANLTAAIELLGLSDYLTDLEQKNQAFATLMSSRTASTEGNVKGAVAAARGDLEEKYQIFRQMLNVASIYEGDTDYRSFILSANAEIEHFRQILARKGISSGSSSTGNGGSNNSGSTTNGNENQNENQGGTDNTGDNTGTNTGSGDNGGTSPDPSQGGENSGGDNGGYDGPGPDDNGGYNNE